MRTLFIIAALSGILSSDSIPEDSGLTEDHIEFLKDNEAYDDFMDAFYPEEPM
jgi:hypothetical protein